MSSPQLEQYRAYAFYNRDFNTRLYDLIEPLGDDERRRDRGAFFGSLHATLDHILLADCAWLARFRDNGIAAEALAGAHLPVSEKGLSQLLCEDWESLVAARRETDNVLTNWANALTTSDLEAIMQYRNFRGETRDHPAWIAITHLFNHQTHHRGQVTTLLSQLGIDPGVTDYLIVVNRGYRARTLPDGS